MIVLCILLVFVLAGAGVWLLLKRDTFDVLLGIAVLSHAVLVAILTAGGWADGLRPPLIVGDTVDVTVNGVSETLSTVDPATYIDPVPQALLLTAIVIGFGLLSFFMALVARERADGRDEEAPAEE